MEFNIIQFPILKTKFHQFTLKGLFLITSLSYLKCSFNLSKSNGKFHRFVTIHSHNTSVTIKNCWFINIHLHNQIESLSGCQLQTVKEAHYNQYRFPHQSKQFWGNDSTQGESIYPWKYPIQDKEISHVIWSEKAYGAMITWSDVQENKGTTSGMSSKLLQNTLLKCHDDLRQVATCYWFEVPHQWEKHLCTSS